MPAPKAPGNPAVPGPRPDVAQRVPTDHVAELKDKWDKATDFLASGVVKLHAAGMDAGQAGRLCLDLFTTVFRD